MVGATGDAPVERNSAFLLPPKCGERRAAGDSQVSKTGGNNEGGRVQSIFRKCVTVAAFVLVGAALAGCSKKDNSAADTSAAAMDTMGVAASSTAPVMQDTTTTAAAPTKSTTKKSTGKTAKKKSTY
jgi:hypothetical protein